MRIYPEGMRNEGLRGKWVFKVIFASVDMLPSRLLVSQMSSRVLVGSAERIPPEKGDILVTDRPQTFRSIRVVRLSMLSFWKSKLEVLRVAGIAEDSDDLSSPKNHIFVVPSLQARCCEAVEFLRRHGISDMLENAEKLVYAMDYVAYVADVTATAVASNMPALVKLAEAYGRKEKSPVARLAEAVRHADFGGVISVSYRDMLEVAEDYRMGVLVLKELAHQRDSPVLSYLPLKSQAGVNAIYMVLATPFTKPDKYKELHKLVGGIGDKTVGSKCFTATRVMTVYEVTGAVIDALDEMMAQVGGELALLLRR
jgi:hypothetical protein